MHAQGMFWAVILARLSFERERSEVGEQWSKAIA